MARYRGNVEAIKGLVRETEVHRDVYIDEEVFQLEMEHVFANTWAYVGHDSQVAKPGDYYGTTIGTQPILMVRHTDGTVKVLHNRCPHKGTRITTEILRQHRKILPLPLSRLELQDRRLAARDPPEEGLREHRHRAEPCRARHEPRQARAQLSRLRVRQAQRCRPRLRGIFRRQPVELRQHGRPLAGRPARSRRRRAALHAQL